MCLSLCVLQVAGGTDIVRKTIAAFSPQSMATKVVIDPISFDGWPALGCLEDSQYSSLHTFWFSPSIWEIPHWVFLFLFVRPNTSPLCTPIGEHVGWPLSVCLCRAGCSSWAHLQAPGACCLWQVTCWRAWASRVPQFRSFGSSPTCWCTDDRPTTVPGMCSCPLTSYSL